MSGRFTVGVSFPWDERDGYGPVAVQLGRAPLSIFPERQQAEDYLEGLVRAGRLPEHPACVFHVIDLNVGYGGTPGVVRI